MTFQKKKQNGWLDFEGSYVQVGQQDQAGHHFRGHPEEKRGKTCLHSSNEGNIKITQL